MGRGTTRNDQVALSPGQGSAVRGTADLIMVEGRSLVSPSTSYAGPPPHELRSQGE